MRFMVNKGSADGSTKQQLQKMRRMRWLAFIIVVLAYVLSFFHRYATATIAPDLQSGFSASSAELGALAATYFYIYMLMQIPTGILADTLGPQKVVAAGGVVAGLGSLLFGMADTLVLASMGRLMVGLGVSVTFISLLKLNAVWFHDRHFGTMTGLSVFIGNMGALLAAAPLAWALEVASWRSVFMMVGTFSLLLALFSWWYVLDHPGKAGLPTMRELEGKSDHPAHKGHWYDGLLCVLKNRATWPGLWVNTGLAGTLFAFAGLWAVPFLCDGYGMTRSEAAGHTGLLLAGFAFGAVVIGVISDRIGRRKPVMLGFALVYTLCWLPLIAGLPLIEWESRMLFLAMGFSAPAFTLSWACAKEVNPPALSGISTSVVNIGAFMGTAILQPLVGWMIDRSHTQRVGSETLPLSVSDYQTGMVIMFVFVLSGLVAVFFVRETRCRYVHESLKL